MLKDAEEHAEEDKKRKDEVKFATKRTALAFRAQKVARMNIKISLPKEVR